MRGLGLKDIIEYIASAIIVVIYVIVLLFIYSFYNTEQYSLQSYEIFTQSLLVDRLNYCMYKITNNPYYLFYAPTNSTLNEYWNNLSNCYMEFSGYFAIPIQYYNITSGSSTNYTVEYANISYTSVPYLIFFDINNLSNTYVFYKEESFVEYYSYGRFIYIHTISPPSSINLNNLYNLYSYLSQYLSNATNYTQQIVENITMSNNTFQDLYNDCFSKSYSKGYFIFPALAQPIFESNMNGEPLVVGIYQFGDAYQSGEYNLTCEYNQGQIVNCTN